MTTQNRFSPVILPVRHLRQPEPGECLVACAAMVLNYWHVSVQYQRLFKLLNIQKGLGTPFPNIREVVRMDVTVVYQRGMLTDLHTFLLKGSPIIVPVRTIEYRIGV